MTRSFPYTRLRRTRQADWIRRLVAENSLSVDDLIWPVFVKEGQKIQEPISSMPGVHRYSMDLLVEKAKLAHDLGIPVISLFPFTDPSLKTDDAKQAYNPDNLICRTVQEIKKHVPDIGIMCDVALDPYTPHGHDGILQNGYVENDVTLEVLKKQSLVLANAGCDILGPSDMMDGRVKVIRQALEKAQLTHTLIMSYTAKYASSFYGPFRDAVGSQSSLKGDKKTYQQDPANADEAVSEALLDLEEGADMLLVKPGLAYLDVVYRIKQACKVPTFVYQVSGEYAMIKAASDQGLLDGDKAMWESLLSCKRAGADGILTYGALDIASQLSKI